MKKILVLLLAVAISASSFAACGGKKDDKKAENGAEAKVEEKAEAKPEEKPEEEKKDNTEAEPEKAEEKVVEATEEKAEEKKEEKPVINYNTEEDKAAAKAAVEGYLKGYCAFDVAAMTPYTNTDLSQKVTFTDYGTYISEKVKSYFSEEETTTVFAEEIGKLETLCKDSIMGSATYEIGDAEYIGTTWQFKVKTSNITLSDIFSVVSGDEAKALTEQLMNELIEKASDPTITEEQLAELANDMLKVSLNAIVDLVTKSCETTEPKTTEYTVTAIKSGDKWLVDYNGKGAQDIVTSLLDSGKN
ncbi:MAG: hypothetical protein E7583_07445 [Ruminococcaceae bacterium]|nr:hypothetical protein [Oscillospiraceae bacterium]